MRAWLHQYPAAVALSLAIAALLAVGSLALFSYLYYFASPLTLFSELAGNPKKLTAWQLSRKVNFTQRDFLGS